MALKLAAERYESADAPEATPMLIAHGLFGSARNWTGLAKRFAEGRPVAVADMRNHGASPWSAETGYPAMGADLLETADSLFGRPALLLGHSMGGKAAMAAALQAPDRVAGLIVADIAPIAYPNHNHGDFIAAMRAADLSTATRRGEIEPQLVSAIPEAPLRAFILANLVFEQTSEGRRARWRLNLEALDAGMTELIGWPEALNGASYDGPSCFLHGGASDYVAAAGQAAIKRLFPKAAIEALPGAGHWLHAEQPDAFAAKVSDWLRGLQQF